MMYSEEKTKPSNAPWIRALTPLWASNKRADIGIVNVLFKGITSAVFFEVCVLSVCVCYVCVRVLVCV